MTLVRILIVQPKEILALQRGSNLDFSRDARRSTISSVRKRASDEEKTTSHVTVVRIPLVHDR